MALMNYRPQDFGPRARRAGRPGWAKPERNGSEGRSLLSMVVVGLDPLLVLLVAAVSAFGVLMVYSATRDTQLAGGADPNLYLTKQAVFASIGLVLMLVVAMIDYRRFLDLSPWMYFLCIVILVAVLFAPAHNGAHGWFSVGQFQLQPTEFGKIVLILGLAAYGGAQRSEFEGRQVRAMVVISAALIGLVFIEPDLGGALVYGTILLAILWVAGASGRTMLILLMAAITMSLVTVKLGILKGYQVKRLTGFIGTPLYHVAKSKIAIGSGGVTGRGLFAGVQTRLGYVPERHTDFIFSVIGEQLGVIGCSMLLLVFGLIFWRFIRIARASRDVAGRLICVGVLALFLFQVFENVGMTMQIMPVTGIPMPLVSYGGSSTIMEFVAVGLVLSVNRRKFR